MPEWRPRSLLPGASARQTPQNDLLSQFPLRGQTCSRSGHVWKTVTRWREGNFVTVNVVVSVPRLRGILHVKHQTLGFFCGLEQAKQKRKQNKTGAYVAEV